MWITIISSLFKIISTLFLTLGEKKKISTLIKASIASSALSPVFYTYLGRRGLVKANPLQFIKRHYYDPIHKTGDLSDQEFKKVLEQVNSSTLSGKMHLAMLFIFLNTGMRNSELRLLRRKNYFHQENFWVLKFGTKGEKERMTPLDPKCQEILECYLHAREREQGKIAPLDYLLVPTRNRSNHLKAREKGLKGPLATSTVDEIVKKYVHMAGINRKIGPHSLRSTAIGSLLENGVDLGEVSEWIGHSNVNTTKRYSKRVTSLKNSPGLKIKIFNENNH